MMKDKSILTPLNMTTISNDDHIYFNPEWMPNLGIALLFMVEIPEGWEIKSKEQIISLAPGRLRSLVHQSNVDGEKPHEMIDDILTIFPERAVLESDNLVEVIMNTDHWAKAVYTFLNSDGTPDPEFSRDDAVEQYQSTTLYQYLVELANY